MVDGSEFPFSMVTKKSEDDDTVCEIWHLRSRKDGEKGYPLRRLATHDNSVDSTCAALGFREDVSVGTCHYDRYDGADCGYADADYYIYAGEFAKAASLTDGPLWRYVNKGRSSSSSAISSVDGTTKTLCRM